MNVQSIVSVRLSFDEAVNRITKSEQLDLAIRYSAPAEAGAAPPNT